MHHILSPLAEALAKQQTIILTTIINRRGSSPGKSGARMLVYEDGTISGTIGGGKVEKDCQMQAMKMYAQEEENNLLHFNLDNATAAQNGMVCGGKIEVLLQKISPQQLPLISLLQQEYQKRNRPLFLTRLPQSGEKAEITAITTDGKYIGAAITPDLLAQILHRMGKVRTPFTISADGANYFAEPLVDSGCLYLVGAGHVSLATAHLAGFAGFAVKVMDDRADFANRNRFPDAEEVIVLQDFTTCLPQLGQDDYVVIVTRGHAHDQTVVEQALASHAGYIGMIGSRKKREVSYQKILEKGFAQKELERIHCPIGLTIGAETPEEIAISIVAELVAHRAKQNILHAGGQ